MGRPCIQTAAGRGQRGLRPAARPHPASSARRGVRGRRLLPSDTPAGPALAVAGRLCLHVFTLPQVRLSARVSEVWPRGRRANVHGAGSVLPDSRRRVAGPRPGAPASAQPVGAGPVPPPPASLPRRLVLCAPPFPVWLGRGALSWGGPATPRVGVCMSQGVRRALSLHRGPPAGCRLNPPDGLSGLF